MPKMRQQRIHDPRMQEFKKGTGSYLLVEDRKCTNKHLEDHMTKDPGNRGRKRNSSSGEIGK